MVLLAYFSKPFSNDILIGTACLGGVTTCGEFLNG